MAVNSPSPLELLGLPPILFLLHPKIHEPHARQSPSRHAADIPADHRSSDKTNKQTSKKTSKQTDTGTAGQMARQFHTGLHQLSFLLDVLVAKSSKYTGRINGKAPTSQTVQEKGSRRGVSFIPHTAFLDSAKRLFRGGGVCE